MVASVADSTPIPASQYPAIGRAENLFHVTDCLEERYMNAPTGES